MEDFRSISVSVGDEKEKKVNKVKVNNPTDYKLIGKGEHGAVFKLSPEKCVKIYAKNKIASMEADAYRRIQGSSLAPKLYEIGPNYIIIEYIEGEKLYKYLRKKGEISKSITRQIIFLLEEMERLGFLELDIALQNVIVTKKGILKMVDYVNQFYWEERRPRALFKQLYNLDLLDSFLEQVKKINYEKYKEWKRIMSQYFE